MQKPIKLLEWIYDVKEFFISPRHWIAYKLSKVFQLKINYFRDQRGTQAIINLLVFNIIISSVTIWVNEPYGPKTD